MKYALQKIGLATGLGLVGMVSGCTSENYEGIAIKLVVQDNKKEECTVLLPPWHPQIHATSEPMWYTQTYETFETMIYAGKPIPETTRKVRTIIEHIKCPSEGEVGDPFVLKRYLILPNGDSLLKFDYTCGRRWLG